MRAHTNRNARGRLKGWADLYRSPRDPLQAFGFRADYSAHIHPIATGALVALVVGSGRVAIVTRLAITFKVGVAVVLLGYLRRRVRCKAGENGSKTVCYHGGRVEPALRH